MAETTGIQWCDSTFNPWMGCLKVSPGCKNCYAERDSKRHGLDVFGPARTTQRRLASETYWRKPIAWNQEAQTARRRRRIFCASFGDVFEDNPQLVESRKRLFDVIAETPWLDWLLLTKRPSNITGMYIASGRTSWTFTPPSNIWLGTSVESPNESVRITQLQDVPAAVRFLSVEPLIRSLALILPGIGFRVGKQIHWVIVGGESGSKDAIRPMHPKWASEIQEWCQMKRVPFFFKQWGNWIPGWIDDPDEPQRNAFVHWNGDVELLTIKPVAGTLRSSTGYREVAPMHYFGHKYEGTLDGVVRHAFPEGH